MSTTNPAPPTPFPIPSPNLPAPSSSLPAPKPGRGRPRVLNDVKLHRILNLMARGCTLEQAAYYIGCAPSTIRREGLRDPEFKEELDKVLLDSEIFALTAVRGAAHSHWRAGRWLLERMDAQRIRDKNRQRLNPRQLRRFTSAIAAALESEISDRDDRHRITERLKQVIRDTNRHLNERQTKPLPQSENRNPKSEIETT